jgi:hypothetical protein
MRGASRCIGPTALVTIGTGPLRDVFGRNQMCRGLRSGEENSE